MKLDQIAYYVHNDDQARELMAAHGLTDAEWVEDEVVGDVTVPLITGPNEVHSSRARLRFCYKMGIEFELLTYLDGPHWHMNKLAFEQGLPFLSHVGYHMDSDWTVAPTPGIKGMTLLQVMNTMSHTNPYLVANKRRYHYRIYELGAFMPNQKFIWRVQP